MFAFFAAHTITPNTISPSHQNHPGPIWNCPAGHLLCDVCYKKESGASKPCFTCNLPMGSTISLVAKHSEQLYKRMSGSLGQGLMCLLVMFV